MSTGKKKQKKWYSFVVSEEALLKRAAERWMREKCLFFLGQQNSN